MTMAGRTMVTMVAAFDPDCRSEYEQRIACDWHPRAFAAIDFETANSSPTSACALGVVRVEGATIVASATTLIRPPTSHFVFTYVHGIRWSDVREKPSFRLAWPLLAPLLDDVDFVAAHNAPFDRRVLHACCRQHRLRPPNLPFVCTVKLARLRWHLYPTKLQDVCDFLDISLQHHDPLSDAVACAQVVLAAGSQRREN